MVRADPLGLFRDLVAHLYALLGFPHSSVGKESACGARDPGSVSGSGRSPGGRDGSHSSTLAWKILWTEEPGGLKSMGRKELGTTERLTLHFTSLQGSSASRMVFLLFSR